MSSVSSVNMVHSSAGVCVSNGFLYLFTQGYSSLPNGLSICRVNSSFKCTHVLRHKEKLINLSLCLECSRCTGSTNENNTLRMWTAASFKLTFTVGFTIFSQFSESYLGHIFRWNLYFSIVFPSSIQVQTSSSLATAKTFLLIQPWGSCAWFFTARAAPNFLQHLIMTP